MDVAVGWRWRSRSAGLKGPNTQAAFARPHYAGRDAAAYTEQALELIEGGVDALQLETSQDILQAKAGLVGIFDALKKSGKNVPVQVEVTLRESGVMLLGTEIGRGAHDAGDVRR
ncbi:MAG TPA: homocysteine S-methyltransferase family protein [Terriglobales bacterium]